MEKIYNIKVKVNVEMLLITALEVEENLNAAILQEMEWVKDSGITVISLQEEIEKGE